MWHGLNFDIISYDIPYNLLLDELLKWNFQYTNFGRRAGKWMFQSSLTEFHSWDKDHVWADATPNFIIFVYLVFLAGEDIKDLLNRNKMKQHFC